jgi:hypothetical protein
MISVRFVGAEGKFQSIETQAVRIHANLDRAAAGSVRSQLSLLPQDFFLRRGLLRRAPVREMQALLEGVQVLVVVKSSLFRDFLKAAPALKDLCGKRGVVLVSNPCDGPGADAGDTADVFTEEVADYALAVSRLQAEAIAKRRPAEEVLLVAHASRLETRNRLEPRPVVRKVIWENAIHRNPRYDERKAGMPREKYQELEDMIRAILRERGAELVFIDAWRETQGYEEWERMMLDSDIAIECKALGNEYVDYQSQKPAVKVLNYMSLGLPVVCDSLPAYRELGEDGKELLFADSLDEWRAQLTRLLGDRELRVRLGEAARKAAEPYGIDNICKRYARFFEMMVNRSHAGSNARPVRA